MCERFETNVRRDGNNREVDFVISRSVSRAVIEVQSGCISRFNELGACCAPYPRNLRRER